MAAIISILNSKGGSGKSTLSINVANALLRRGYKTLLADSDPQGTVSVWRQVQPNGAVLPPVVGVTTSMDKDLPALESVFDFIVVDGAAKIDNISASAIKVSEFVLIPVQPSAADIWACNDLVELLKIRHQLVGLPHAAFVVARQIKNTNLAGGVLSPLAEMGIRVFSSRTSQRVAYAETMAEGLTVYEGNDKKAMAEIDAITNELLTWQSEIH